MSVFFVVVFLLFSLFSTAEMCIALGCLGVSCFPPPPCIFPPCTMGCPCGAGMQCIAGGCIMARARGAKTYQDKELDSSQQIEDPNSHFLTCCNLLDVPEACYHMCSYQGYNKDALMANLWPFSKCPISALPQVHFCAARGTDHTRCCQDAKIPRTCEVFCDQRPGNVTNLTLEHLQCFEKFEDIKVCFLEHSLGQYYEAKHRYREFGKLLH